LTQSLGVWLAEPDEYERSATVATHVNGSRDGGAAKQASCLPDDALASAGSDAPLVHLDPDSIHS
jgi:hypothetical protein